MFYLPLRLISSHKQGTLFHPPLSGVGVLFFVAVCRVCHSAVSILVAIWLPFVAPPGETRAGAPASLVFVDAVVALLDSDANAVFTIPSVFQ